MRWFELTLKEKFGRFAIGILAVLAMYFRVIQTEVVLVFLVGFSFMLEHSITTRIELEVMKADIEELKKHLPNRLDKVP
jgi:hypothetical protein